MAILSWRGPRELTCDKVNHLCILTARAQCDIFACKRLCSGKFSDIAG